MKNILKILGFAALLPAQSAFAITPENGWWWNPAESGRGFNIETQNGVVFIATFVYDNNGNPIWYSGSGQLDANSTVAANLQISQNGPCLTCPYQTPTTSDAGMPITLQFTSQNEGSVSWQGNTTPIPIQRFNFALGGNIPKLNGEWAVMLVNPLNGDFYGDRLVIKGGIEGSAGSGGYRFGSPSNSVDNMVMIGYSPNQYAQGYNYFGVAFQGAGAPSKYFIFNLDGLNRIVGLMQLEDTSLSVDEAFSDVANNGLQFEGYRITR